MAVTLKDIAIRAGVSQAAVSIALGSSGRISTATRERILGIADELGYRPNLLVQGIQTGRTQTIGLLMDFATGFESQLFEGIQDALSARNYVPIVLSHNGHRNELKQIHSLLDRRVDGVLVRPVDDAIWEDHLDEVQQRNVPVVAVNTEIQANVPHIDFVGTDDRHGARLVAEHLLELGHRRFGVVSRGSFPDPMFVRAEAFVQAVGEVPDTTCEVRLAGWRDQRFEDNAARAMMSLDPRPTAVFSTNDDLAGSVRQAAIDRGLSIPKDLSLAGFGDVVAWRGDRPVLTTVRQDPFAIGHTAAGLLLDRVDERQAKAASPPPRQSIRHKPELIVRETTGQAPPA